jgi:aromatic ring hydroxylase
MAMQSEFNGRMLEIIRELVSSSMISVPSSMADFENPEIAPYIERYMRSGSMNAKSDVVEGQVGVFHTNRDSDASEIGQRCRRFGSGGFLHRLRRRRFLGC